MKHWLIALLVSCVCASAQMGMRSPALVNTATKPKSVVTTCNTLQDTNGVRNDQLRIADADQRKYVASPFTATNTTTLCKARVVMIKGGDFAFTFSVAIYSDSAGSPGSIVGSASDSVASGSIPLAYDFVTFTNLSASVTANTPYWLVLIASSVSASDYVRMGTIYHVSALAKSSPDGTSWTNEAANPIALNTFSSP